VGLDEQHAGEPIGEEDGDGQLAARCGQAREGDLRRQDPIAGLRDAFPQGPAIAVFRRRMVDADRRSFARGHPDDAVAAADLGPDAGLWVATGRDGVQGLSRLIDHQDHGLPNAEVMLQRVERPFEQGAEVAGRGKPRSGAAHGGEQVALRQRGVALAAGDALDRADPVDVGPLQVEHACHAGV